MFGMEKKLGNKLAGKFFEKAQATLDKGRVANEAGDIVNATLWITVANALHIVGETISEVVNED